MASFSNFRIPGVVFLVPATFTSEYCLTVSTYSRVLVAMPLKCPRKLRTILSARSTDTALPEISKIVSPDTNLSPSLCFEDESSPMYSNIRCAIGIPATTQSCLTKTIALISFSGTRLQEMSFAPRSSSMNLSISLVRSILPCISMLQEVYILLACLEATLSRESLERCSE